jgi:hypothetical protein
MVKESRSHLKGQRPTMKDRQRQDPRESTGRGETFWQNSNAKLRGALLCSPQKLLTATTSDVNMAFSLAIVSEQNDC